MYFFMSRGMEAEIKRSYYDGIVAGIEQGKEIGRKNAYKTDYPEPVWIMPSGAKYHTRYCPYLNENAEETTMGEALEDGYTACSKCDPPKP